MSTVVAAVSNVGRAAPLLLPSTPTIYRLLTYRQLRPLHVNSRELSRRHCPILLYPIDVDSGEIRILLLRNPSTQPPTPTVADFVGLRHRRSFDRSLSVEAAPEISSLLYHVVIRHLPALGTAKSLWQRGTAQACPLAIIPSSESPLDQHSAP